MNIVEAQKMSVADRLQYAFYIAEKEFKVRRLFEPIGKVLWTNQESFFLAVFLKKERPQNIAYCSYCEMPYFWQMLNEEIYTRKPCWCTCLRYMKYYVTLNP